MAKLALVGEAVDVDLVYAVYQALNGVDVLGQVESSVPGKVTLEGDQVQLCLDTAVRNFGGVDLSGRETGSGVEGQVDQEVAGLLVVETYVDTYAVVEEATFDTEFEFTPRARARVGGYRDGRRRS